MRIVPLSEGHSDRSSSISRFLQEIGYSIYRDASGNLYAAIEQSQYLPLSNVTTSFELDQIPCEWKPVEHFRA
ncbi:MAG TPA: hypothetical protein VFC63_17180 [Blastocatellia bacterium]|nr:hypothetical protein [Blastocatellia bacterium]